MGDTNSFLDIFLKRQLLDIGNDDCRFGSLQTAANQIGKALKADLWRLARYTRVGLDRDIDPNEPVFIEIEEAIKEHWKLIRNRHTDRPIAIIRAVLWESVRQAADEDRTASVIALVAKSEAESANLGPEAEACTLILLSAIERMERIGEKAWAGPSDSEIFRTSRGTKARKAMFTRNCKLDLLWWSQSRFSLTAKMGFAEIPKILMPFFLAADVHRIASNVCPQAVDHFLAHVVHDMADKLQEVAVVCFFDAFLELECGPLVAEVIAGIPVDAGRCGLLSLIKETLDCRFVDDFQNRLDIGYGKVSLPYLAKRVFWELTIASVVLSAGKNHD